MTRLVRNVEWKKSLLYVKGCGTLPRHNPERYMVGSKPHRRTNDLVLN